MDLRGIFNDPNSRIVLYTSYIYVNLPVACGCGEEEAFIMNKFAFKGKRGMIEEATAVKQHQKKHSKIDISHVTHFTRQFATYIYRAQKAQQTKWWTSIQKVMSNISCFLNFNSTTTASPTIQKNIIGYFPQHTNFRCKSTTTLPMFPMQLASLPFFLVVKWECPDIFLFTIA